MNVFKKISFNFENQDYNVKVLYNDREIRIVPFLNNHPATGFRYQIIVPKNVDTKKMLKINDLTNFIEMAKQDIIEKRWDNFSKSFSENN
jgi:hypothetical protein